jgi:sugar diacid utilization regulator
MAGEAVWALLPAWGDADPGTLITGITERVGSALGATAIVALGELGAPLAEVTASRVELGHVLRVLARPEVSLTVARRRDVHAALVLIELTQTLAASPWLQLEAVTGMIEHDRTQGGGYVDTLLAYFDCLADIPAAAERVSVHPNTVRYRLRRLREVFGVDLEDPDERLVLWLQLKALSQP